MIGLKMRLVFATSLLVIADIALGAQIQFEGTVVFVNDQQTGSLANMQPGAVVSGSVTYGDSSAEGQFCGGDSLEYSCWFFGQAYEATINANGNQYADSRQLRMDIVDNAPQSAAGSAVFNGLFGQSSLFDVGNLYDDWGINAWPTNALVGGNNPSGDDDYYTGGGVFIAVAARSFNENLYSSADYVRVPPTLGDPVYGQFRIVERAVDGTSIYDGTGYLTALTAVPLPSAILFFFPAIVGLFRLWARTER